MEPSADPPRPQRVFWRTPSGIALLGFLAVALFFLVTEHAAHLFGVLPVLLLLACPLMHLFHHRRHGGHHDAGTPPPPISR